MIVNSVLLQLDVPAAFALFTQQIGNWWPADRRHTKDPRSTIVLLASGPFYERASDGLEIELGKVTSWEEPHCILLDFYIATGPDHPTEVEIRFEAEGNGARVTVTHRPKSESAHLWDARSPKYAAAWRIVLEALVKVSVSG